VLDAQISNPDERVGDAAVDLDCRQLRVDDPVLCNPVSFVQLSLVISSVFLVPGDTISTTRSGAPHMCASVSAVARSCET
jgi:hypothetical protein